MCSLAESASSVYRNERRVAPRRFTWDSIHTTGRRGSMHRSRRNCWENRRSEGDIKGSAAESGYSEENSFDSVSSSQGLENSDVDKRYRWSEGRRRRREERHVGDSLGERPRHCPRRLTMKLREIKSFTTFFESTNGRTTKSFLSQFETEASMVGKPQSQWVRLFPFSLKVSALSCFLSNADQFRNYLQFRRAFMQYYHSDSITCVRFAIL